MAFKMRYGKQGPPMYDKSFATKYGHDKGPTFNPKLRKEATDPNTTMNENFKKKVLGMPKHGESHKMSADEKRKEVLIEKLNKMSDPMDSNQGKATLKAIKKIDPNFDAETYM